MAPLTRRIVVTLLLGGVLLALGFYTLRKLAASRQKPAKLEKVVRPIAVRVMRAEKTSYRETLVGYGRARPLRRARVSAEVAGLVAWVSPRLEAGAAVEVDEELVRLDARDLVQAVESAKARIAKNGAQVARLETDIRSGRRRLELARREFEASQRELDRLRDLEKRAAASKSELDRQTMETALREAAVLRLEGDLESFEAQILTTRAEAGEIDAARKQAENDLGRAVVRAPFAGRIEERRVEAGERVSAGSGLFDLVDPLAVEIPVALPASSYGHVAAKTPARVRLGGQTRSVEVARVAPTVRAEDRTYYVYLVPQRTASANPVPPGAFVTAEIGGRAYADVFVIPRPAVVAGRVFVVDGEVARVRTPEVQALLPGVLLATGGLEDGEQVILTNLEEIADGTRVVAVHE